MSFTVTFEEVEAFVINGLAAAQKEAPKWLARCVTVIKTGRDIASPLLQEKSVAAAAFMISTFVLYNMISRLTNACKGLGLQQGNDSLANKGKVVLEWTISAALFATTAVATARFLNLPLTSAEIAGYSAISAAAYSLIY